MDALLEATYRAEQRHFWFHGFRRFVRPLVARALAGVARPRILDCGCGTGANLVLLGEFGAAYGVDLNRVGLEFARREGRRRIARATVAALPIGDACVDLVTSFDVLYSLEDAVEAAAIAEMFRVLKPGGAAVINVAAMRVLHGTHSVLSQEVRRYDRPRLRVPLERAGFRIERLTYTNATLFPMMAAARLAQRLLGRAGDGHLTADITVPPAPINAALAGLLAAEAALVRRVDMPFGSSLLCLARKRKPISER
jgi:SAM-dependent methyltransferase